MSLRKIIFTAEEDIFGISTFDNEKMPNLADALLSNPLIIEVLPTNEVERGWIFDGINFYPPEVNI